MNALGKTLLPITFSVLVVLSVCSTGAHAADDAAKRADKSAADAAASAASAAGSAKAAESAAAKFDLPVSIAVGDRIKLRSNISELEGVNGATKAYAPRYTCLRVNRLGPNGGLTVSVEENTLIGSCETPSETPSGKSTDRAVVKPGDSYIITAEQLTNASYSRYGWIYGPMIVPFKYFPHDRSFESSQSLGMYMGYRTSWFESRGLSFVGSAGLATMKVSEVVDDPAKPGNKTTKENTIAGYTVAGGLMFDLTREAKPFVAGLLVGRDFVGRNSALAYKHDNKTWIALQFGWAQ